MGPPRSTDEATKARALIADRPPLGFPCAVAALARCVVRTFPLMARRELHQPTERLGTRPGLRRRLPWSRLPRDRRGGPPGSTTRRSSWSRSASASFGDGVGHALFRAESLLNTPLFVGFPGFISKLWLAPEGGDTYRGVYQWDGAARADAYVRALRWALAPVCARGSIRYVIVPGLRRDDVLADPHCSTSYRAGTGLPPSDAPCVVAAHGRGARCGLTRRTAPTCSSSGRGRPASPSPSRPPTTAPRVQVIDRRSEPSRPSRGDDRPPPHPRGPPPPRRDRRPPGPTATSPPPRTCTSAPPGRPARLDALDLPDCAFPHLLLVRQADVEAVLLQALARRGIPVTWDAEAVAVTASHDGVVAALRDHGAAAARFAVGCDGPTSTVRRSLDTTWSGGPYRQEVVLADVELDGDLEPGVAHAVPAPGGSCSSSTSVSTRRGDCSPPARARAVGPVRPAWPVGRRRRPPGAPRRERPRRTPPFGRLVLPGGPATPSSPAPSGPGLFVAGDAAHAHSPAGGLGMNTGIQDATNLGWKLAFAARAGEERREVLLDSYEQERRPAARTVLAMTHLVFHAEASTGPLVARRVARRRSSPPALPSSPGCCDAAACSRRAPARSAGSGCTTGAARSRWPGRGGRASPGPATASAMRRSSRVPAARASTT